MYTLLQLPHYTLQFTLPHRVKDSRMVSSWSALLALQTRFLGSLENTTHPLKGTGINPLFIQFKNPGTW